MSFLKQQYTGDMAKWILLPLRLFLGVTFVYAGLQKLANPQYLQPTAIGYVGNQISAFAINSPLHSFLLQVAAPHAVLFGLMVALGELAIGLGVLFGVFFRLAACFGLLLNLVFFLSATWQVYPYFYGSDIVFLICWIPLVLNGPLNTGWAVGDVLLFQGMIERLAASHHERLARFWQILLGLPGLSGQTTGVQSPSQERELISQPVSTEQKTRRSFVFGAVAGIVGGLSFGYAIFALRFQSLGSSGSQTASASVPHSANSSAPTGVATASLGPVIAQVDQFPGNSAITFTDSLTGKPGILLNLGQSKYCAYSAICTHAACNVQYDTNSQLLVCPCHGASFNPAKAGAVVEPPATTALPSIAIQIDLEANVIRLEPGNFQNATNYP